MEDFIKNYSNLSSAKQRLVESMLKEKGIEISDVAILPQKRNGKPFPASFAQKRLWFLEQFEPGSPLYIIPLGVKIRGSLNNSILTDAIKKIVERHEVLRTSFDSIDGEVYQLIHEEIKVDVIPIDISAEKDLEELLY